MNDIFSTASPVNRVSDPVTAFRRIATDKTRDTVTTTTALHAKPAEKIDPRVHVRPAATFEPRIHIQPTMKIEARLVAHRNVDATIAAPRKNRTPAQATNSAPAVDPVTYDRHAHKHPTQSATSAIDLFI